MRAVLCLDPRTPFDRIEEVTRAARLDGVVVGMDAADDDDLCARLADSALRVIVNVPLLHSPEVLAEHPELYAVTSTGRRAAVDWLHMACPSSERFWELQSARIADRVARLEPDLVSLDFARGFVRWETVPPGAVAADIEHGCCCARCVGDRPYGLAELARRRTDLVTARVAQASDLVRSVHPGVPVAVKVVPWLAADHEGARAWACGQDPARLAPLVDVVMPMSYTAMIGRPTQHVRDVHDELSGATGLPVMPWLQAAHADEPGDLPLDVVAQMLAAVEQDAEHGFCVFHLDGIAHRPELLALLAEGSPMSDLKEML